MDFLANSNCITLLSEHAAAHTNMKLQDSRASNWPSAIYRALFIDRSHNCVKKFIIAEPANNSPALILMRLGIESASLYDPEHPLFTINMG
ncbi:hypothetical protein [Pseudomonas sp. RL_5y_Pfl2_73]|uniref:hypothetical protein n=1 Tax=Pseudomonas sp. RL_5y_Pfl2_73 TaxID=3088713 RepID=UPI0030DBEBD8